MVYIGAGSADITPEVGLTTLSGFTVRNNRPTSGIHSRLTVQVLAFKVGEEFSLLFSYELMGIGSALEEIIFQALEAELGEAFDRSRCVLTATHTHSAPPAVNFAGQEDLNASYLARVGRQSADAARQAVDQLTECSLWMAQMEVPGLTYNRRSVLADGRVSIKLDPGEPVIERGPLDVMLTLLVWRNSAGENLAAVAHYPVHGVSVLTQSISGDIPGAIQRGYQERLRAPCLFLQGATGDINPIITRTDGGEKFTAWMNEFFAKAEGLEGQLQPVPDETFGLQQSEVVLDYTQLPSAAFLENRIRLFQKVADGDFTSNEVGEIIPAIRELSGKNPGEPIEPVSAKQTAKLLADCDQSVLGKIKAKESLAAPPLKVACWRMGTVVFAFASVEVFAITGQRIRALSESLTMLPVSFSSRMMGYLPDDDAMDKGGYEADYSWRLYLHPAPFAKGAEERVIQEIESNLKPL
ncbi:MAG TPA: neutral/alkaline non-lysosomal ceramidase N-terminal domain-containing protein [Anaerolineales bacterium]|nr:neutral/alkaline non-lysosomal ceramidase N-terminal domain-containing protein [Anaerolineales bacterium]